MGVLKTLTDEYFGDSIRKEDEINISGLDVEIVKFKDNNGVEHKHGYRVIDGDPNKMAKTLKTLIERIIEKRGSECSLNDIDVSNIKHMYYRENFYYGIFENSSFDGDISGWNVSNVTSINSMFCESEFTGKNGIFSLEKGNKVEDMSYVFYDSYFDGDLSGWNVSNVKSIHNMFSYSDFTGKNGMFRLEKGNKVEDMSDMFCDSPFEVDINDWEVNGYCNLINMFKNTPLENNNKLPKWYLDRQ